VHGIAAAVKNSAGGMGVAFGAKLVAVKVFPDLCEGADDFAIVQAIEYAGVNGVQVANLSLGREGGISQVMKVALQDAIAAGTLFVMAAGNEGTNNDVSAIWPANYANVPGTAGGVISVAASDQADELALFSNFGPTTVTLAAPGVNIYSTVRNETPADDYAYWAGTSMAAPVVAGVAALVLQAEPSLTPAEVKRRLIESGDNLPSADCPVQSGRRVNAFNAVQGITSPSPCAALTVLAAGGRSACLVTWLTEGTLSREQLNPLREVREALWQQGPQGRAVVRGYYRGSAAIIAWARGVGARIAAAIAGRAVTTAI
jgi:subtilisin family serine protease